MRNLLYLVLLSTTLFLTGCGKSVPQRWQNFKAYYNTYYNAKTSFEGGYEKNQNLELNVVEGRPIRMYFPPGQAGAQEFQNTIEKGADILRKHEKSEFVEPAILLIGKSYFFRREFFSAQQKFGELRRITSDPELRQWAVFWEARTLFEMELYTQAVDFAEQELLNEEKWNPQIEAETALILAESHVSLGNFLTAIQLIDPALPQVKDKDLRARGYFLLGQLLQFEGEYDLASEAYEEVIRSKRAYELIYQSQKQQAVSLRESGDVVKAEEIFNRLIKDDKNIDVRSELRVELAKTYQKAGKTEDALALYDQVLRDPIIRPGKLTQAQTFYGIADIYREQFEDYVTASFYYDSAAAISLTEQERPPDFDAAELATIFGEYATIQSEITHLDSLIRLANLPKAERDSVINVLRSERLAAFEEEQKRREAERDKLVVVDAESQSEQPIPGLGFLNHLDSKRVEDTKIQFRALWNERPLVDNWRRMEAVRAAPLVTPVPAKPDAEAPAVPADDPSSVPERLALSELRPEALQNGEEADSLSADFLVESQPEVSAEVSESLSKPDAVVEEPEPLFVEDPMDRQLGIILAEIPLDSIALENSLQRLYARKYELANLLYFSLEMDDRAADLYRTIADSSKDVQLRTQSLYVLSGLMADQERMGLARDLAIELVGLNPESIFADRAAETYGLDSLLALKKNALKAVRMPEEMSADSSLLPMMQDSTLNEDRLSVLSEFEQEKSDWPEGITVDSLLNSVLLDQDLMVEGKPAEPDQIAQWLYKAAQEDTDLTRKPYLLYEAARVYAEIALENEKDLYSGESWDNVRKILEEFRNSFPSHPLFQSAELILKEIVLIESVPDSVVVPDSIVGPDSTNNPDLIQIPDSIQNY